uniref:Uncharacterized protein n=1 Tax=Anguilla anguilla TaxID=7936 RepID=A0A0E9R124_ANGAN
MRPFYHSQLLSIHFSRG